MVHFLDLVPIEPRRIFNRGLKTRLGFAVGHHIQPIAVTAILGDPFFVRCEADGPAVVSDALDLNSRNSPDWVSKLVMS